MNKFKVGDRVVIYDRENKYKGNVFASWGDCLGVTVTYSGITVTVHYKQCRRLKPKAKSRKFRGEWKKVFVNQTMPGQQMAFVPFEPFVDLQSLEGKDDYLIQVRGAT